MLGILQLLAIVDQKVATLGCILTLMIGNVGEISWWPPLFNDEPGFSGEPTHADGESSDACRGLDINARPSWSWGTCAEDDTAKIWDDLLACIASSISMQLSELQPYAHLWL